ncbi:hypothetical protein pb186bvf_001741 [Paramecium bursaria]
MDNEDVVCQQCQIAPQQYIMLDCEHKFCLNCLSQVFVKDDSGVCCPLCNLNTMLDEDTLAALQKQKQSKQPKNPVVKPFTTDKRSYNQPTFDDMNVKGHPFMEKLNIALERTLDNIRNIQFDKMQFREKCQSLRHDMMNEFKQLHMYLDSRYEQHLNELSRYESSYVDSLTNKEENQELEIQEIQIMKNEVKRILNENDGIQDISQFKSILNTVDNIASNKQLSLTQLSDYKIMQEELNCITKKWTDFYIDYKNFFNSYTENGGFITQSRLQKAMRQSQIEQKYQISAKRGQGPSYIGLGNDSPINGQSFITQNKKRSRVSQNSSPFDTNTVLKSSIIRGRNPKNYKSQMTLLLSQLSYN